MLNGSSSLNGSSGYALEADRTEPWIMRACAGLVSRWPWHGGL